MRSPWIPRIEIQPQWIRFALLWIVMHSSCGAQTRVEDIFGRSLNHREITLVDVDGYMANPLIKVFVSPPTNALLPGTASLNASGARLYFESPGTVGPDGPSTTVSFPTASTRVPVRLSIFPDRDGTDETYTLTIVFTGANNFRQTNTVPIHVLDQDLQRTNEFEVTVNFDRDSTGFFTHPVRRSLVQQAANDWAYFFGGMNLDAVEIGDESTFIWSNNFSGGYFVNNTNRYRGYQLYAYGTTNTVHRSGGEGSYSGDVQHSAGTPLTIKRSGGFESEINGNYNTLGWLLLTNDNDWHLTGNLGNEKNDFYSIAHHEIGHALIFNPAHPGFSSAKSSTAFRSAAVTNYYGRPVPIDAFDHLDGVIDPESGQGVFGYEYHGSIPRKRWLITKLDLLCAEEVGYTLRNSSALSPLTFDPQTPPTATTTVPYSFKLQASGGIPVYDWTIVRGSLPPGITFDRFTGELAGTSAVIGAFECDIQLRDYHDNGPGIVRTVLLKVAPPLPIQLKISIIEAASNRVARVTMESAEGHHPILQASSNLVEWTSIATNVAGSNSYRFSESLAPNHLTRFYRGVLLP